MSRKRVTYRPSKANGVFGLVVGVIFVLIGLFVVVPTAGPFGILWTLMAVGITAANAYQAFGGKYAGPRIEIEDDSTTSTATVENSAQSDPKTRLKQLQELKDAGLISDAEYEQKRSEIVRSL